MRKSTKAALGVAAMVMAVVAVRAGGTDSGESGTGLDIVFPPDGHVFRDDEDVQLALLFSAESAEVVVRASSVQRMTPENATLTNASYWLALVSAPPGLSYTKYLT